MTDIMLPAPLWRRLAAATYDGLLLLGIWMVCLLVDTVVRDSLGTAREWHALRAFLFLIGLGFFGWFWTHGGQTLGMRAWRLKLRRVDGRALTWLNALTRYAVMLLCWGVALTPLVMQLPLYASRPGSSTIAALSVVVIAVTLVLMRLDARRRAPQDYVAQCEMIELPKP
ncbi:RDD family protein [Sinimarinibacterium sp. CAU 1509]|uniref:RDD family protein n=1 Tax=Sinimarinibacterium sp. CAU 1509 TaxID=2562283 RepID=UPI0010ABFFA3|nr:RDD family protein [Sinimarinibacterium sp. CAU 1509]TJY61111.1 RDD family protein [Sinimarinibacterium sp. CAU 1509]